MERWSTERVREAAGAWRWRPPASKRVVTDDYELLVTPGSYSLTYVYGLNVREGRAAEVLGELRSRVRSLGGTGARIQLSPVTQPPDLARALEREGYRLLEETDILAWELQEPDGRPRPPNFGLPAGIAVREATTDAEYETYHALNHSIFGNPPPSAEVLQGFSEGFHQRLEQTGHSDRYLAWRGEHAVGLGGMEVAGDVARFFGSGVLPEVRGRGVYGALVRTRCESAAERGAEIALVLARKGTSGPILARRGFRSAGTLRIYEAQWSSDGRPSDPTRA
jgi:N-acetylglutamate synthase-like GNAT family acetyltransferase